MRWLYKAALAGLLSIASCGEEKTLSEKEHDLDCIPAPISTPYFPHIGILFPSGMPVVVDFDCDGQVDGIGYQGGYYHWLNTKFYSVKPTDSNLTQNLSPDIQQAADEYYQSHQRLTKLLLWSLEEKLKEERDEAFAREHKVEVIPASSVER